jgi:formate-dependent nitrite reductase membrane component NrfD
MSTETTAFASRPASGGHATLVEQNRSIGIPMDALTGPSYYDIPLLKRPVWTWEIGCYFFLGGLSAGSYLLGRLAERFGGRTHHSVSRAGTAVAVVALLPCPALLIADLGDPSRFHHMLRVFKPRSPMNLGSWVLTGYGGVLFLTAIREWLRRRDPSRNSGVLGNWLMLGLDAAGLPLAMLFSGYTGVLLSATATPVWSRNPWLGPLFTASAISNGAAAIGLVLEASHDQDAEAEETDQALDALVKIDTIAHVAEGAALAGYLSCAGELAQPLRKGSMAPFFWGAVAGLVASEVLKRAPSTNGRRSKIAAGLVGLASGLALKWAIQKAGPASAADPEADRKITRARG